MRAYCIHCRKDHAIKWVERNAFGANIVTALVCRVCGKANWQAMVQYNRENSCTFAVPNSVAEKCEEDEHRLEDKDE